MVKPPIPENEDKRFKVLKSYNILDTLSEKEYDQITFLASHICDTPISLITLIDDKRQWFKSSLGLDVSETARELAFCSHAINSPQEILQVEDARLDERFRENPFVLGDPNVVFYAGAPLNTPNGHSLGTLCVIDSKPRVLDDGQKKALKSLADQVMTLLELRKRTTELEKLNKEIKIANQELDQFSYGLSHDLQTPARGILRLLEWVESDHVNEFEGELAEKFDLIKSRALYMHNLIDGVMTYAKSKRTEIVFERFNLSTLLTNIAEQCTPYQSHQMSQSNTDVEIYQSKVAIGVCLQNLISNSVKYTDKEMCYISCSLEERESEYFIVYKDNGPGIAEQYFDKVFEMYETLGAKSERSTGIGLATARAILKKAGGFINLVNSGDAEGVCFEIVLPKIDSGTYMHN